MPRSPLRWCTVAGGGVQGAAAIVAGCYLGVRGVVSSPTSVATTEMLAVIAVAGGIGLLALVRAWWGGHGWARSPIVVLQILFVPVAYGLAQGQRWEFAVPLGLSVAATMAGIVADGAAMGTPDAPDAPDERHGGRR